MPLHAAQEQASKIVGLTRLLNAFDAAAPPDEVARTFAGELRRFLPADAVLIYAFDFERGQRVRVAYEGEGEGATPVRRVPLGESASFRAMREAATAMYDAANAGSAPAWLQAGADALGLRSAIAVRLDVEGAAVGMVAAGAREPGRLGEPELQFLREAAAPLGVVLERAREINALQQQTLRTQAVMELLAALGPNDTLEEIAQPVAKALRSMHDADHAAIAVLDGEDLVLAGSDSSVVPEWQPGLRFPPQPLFDYLLHHTCHVTGQSVTGGVAASSASDTLQQRGLRSMMRVLIGTPAAPIGCVALGSKTPDRFTEADARQLALIVQPLALAMSHVRSREEAALRATRLEHTNRILTRLSGGGTAEHLASGFLAECRSLFSCQHATAIRFDPHTQTASMLAVDSSVLDDLSPSLVASSCDHVPGYAGPQLIPDASRAPIQDPLEASLVAAGLLSVMRAPLMVQEGVRGSVSLWARGEGAFTADDAELLATLARPFAIALERAAALESLGESELKYRSLVAQAEEMIFQFDSETRAILDANAYTSRALGYEPQELLRLRLDDILDSTGAEVAASIASTIETGELHLVDRRYRRKDGSFIDVDMVASLISYGRRQAVLVLARDVSERKALQRQLMQGQKMESLGTMAGHVAHDFNNLLTTILGFAGLLKRSTGLDSEERENLALIEDAARRAADLTGHLLAFARGGLVRFGPVDLRNVVTDTMKLAEPTLHSLLTAEATMPAAPVMVEGDAGQLQHALFNIVSNARDAMPEGGTLDVELRCDDLLAVLTIRDDGPGMDDETRTRIFEPFYTTKPVGTGTGLGMSITYGIIQGHHGDITVASRKGHGTTFTITLPLLPAGASASVVDAFNAGEGNLVLVVDDDEMVRRTTSATLADLGYNVVEAPGGATAVEIVRARPERFSVVLLDLVMPGMTGSETFRALTAIRPDLPVVVCTGYAADAHIDIDVKRRIAGLVQKPFTGERLGRALLAAGATPTRAPRR